MVCAPHNVAYKQVTEISAQIVYVMQNHIDCKQRCRIWEQVLGLFVR